MNRLSSFNDLSLTKLEMKIVKGGQGQCYLKDGDSISRCSGLDDCKTLVNAGWGQWYCCTSCNDASWCQGGKCP